MKNLKIFLSLLTLVIIASCSTTPQVNNTTNVTSNTIPSVGHDGNLFKVLEYRNFNQYDKEKYIAIANKGKEVVNGKCFEEKILAAELIQTGDRTNKEVLDHIRSSYTEIILNKYYKRFSKVQGYTYPNSNVINLNWKFHKYYGTCDAAHNLIHEVSHKYGYTHDYKATVRRPKSVPYAVGRIVGECCQLMEGN